MLTQAEMDQVLDAANTTFCKMEDELDENLGSLEIADIIIADDNLSTLGMLSDELNRDVNKNKDQVQQEIKAWLDVTWSQRIRGE